MGLMPESKSYPIALYHNSKTQSNCPLTRSVYFAALLRQNWLSNSRACRLIGFARMQNEHRPTTPPRHAAPTGIFLNI